MAGAKGSGGGRKGAGRPKGSVGERAASLLAAFKHLEDLGEVDKLTLIRKVWKMLDSKDEHVVLKASDQLFDRWFGRPPVAVTGADGGPLFSGSPTDEVNAILALAAAAK